MTLRILIVDDEPLGLAGVRSLLADEPDMEVVGEARNGQEAVARIRGLRPDVVFLDVQMPGMDGFEVLEELGTEELPLVVFVTAFDRYSLQAFEVHAVDYLLKPLTRHRFAETLRHVRRTFEGREAKAAQQRVLAFLEGLEQQRERLDRFVVRSGDRIQFLRAREVEAIEATGNYMHLYRGGESHMIRETLGALEQRLDPACFVRTHRSWIVNLEAIQELRVSEGGYTLVTRGGTRVPVSKGHREPIDALLKDPLPHRR